MSDDFERYGRSKMMTGLVVGKYEWRDMMTQGGSKDYWWQSE